MIYQPVVAPLLEDAIKVARTARWLPAYAWQRVVGARTRAGPEHLIFAIADHFEPSIEPEAPERLAPLELQRARLDRWCTEYPKALADYRDADGHRFRRTYFSPAEQFDESLVRQLAAHCAEGWGEIEIHLHHGMERPDTAARTRAVLEEFRDRLAELGCLSRWDGGGPPRYAFVHGNWALANSADGRNCGVDDEMRILAETGCYADLTLPSAPNPAQVAKINAVYECSLPLSERAPHRKGRDLQVGRPPSIFPLIVQGPLALRVASDRSRPVIDNAAVTSRQPATMARLRLWRSIAPRVAGRPDWIFIKLHCHGMDPRDESAMFGDAMRRFLADLQQHADSSGDRIHFVTAREMVNMLLAACDGVDGDPGRFRDYRLRAPA